MSKNLNFARFSRNGTNMTFSKVARQAYGLLISKEETRMTFYKNIIAWCISIRFQMATIFVFLQLFELIVAVLTALVLLRNMSLKAFRVFVFEGASLAM